MSSPRQLGADLMRIIRIPIILCSPVLGVYLSLWGHLVLVNGLILHWLALGVIYRGIRIDLSHGSNRLR